MRKALCDSIYDAAYRNGYKRGLADAANFFFKQAAVLREVGVTNLADMLTTEAEAILTLDYQHDQSAEGSSS